MKRLIETDIIDAGEIYQISDKFHIISGLPFLIFNREIVILGDLHFGQQQTVYSNSTGLSSDCIKQTKNLVDLLEKSEFDINEVVLNGDIKHFTNSINPQEQRELIYYFDNIVGRDVRLTVLKGNHDKLIEYISPTDHGLFQIMDNKYIQEYDILIFHGHEIPHIRANINIISHEHPTYIFRGHNRVKVKVPAFVKIELERGEALITPMANSFSGGVNFPPSTKKEFLSPLLQKEAIISSIELFPFHPEIGILQLPPVKYWKG